MPPLVPPRPRSAAGSSPCPRRRRPRPTPPSAPVRPTPHPPTRTPHPPPRRGREERLRPEEPADSCPPRAFPVHERIAHVPGAAEVEAVRGGKIRDQAGRRLVARA